MRPPSIQYFYLEKPTVLLIVITLLSVFLWIGRGDFYTKGEPREASVAVSMIEKNQWILPEVYADEIAYKPPLMHWLTAVFSLPEGKVTPFSARLPSALSFLGLVICSFMFFGRNLKMQEAFLTALILLTAFETHRSAMTARVDMLLTFLIVLVLTLLYRWEEDKQLNGFPFFIPIIMSLAVLAKGPVGIVLPLLIFSVYLLFLRYNILIIIRKLIILALPALILPFIWYFFAFLKGGDDFLELFLAENFGRFLQINNWMVSYDLGHKGDWWYNWASLAGGFIPWIFLLVISLFGLSYKRFPPIKKLWTGFIQMEKIKLFSALAAIIVFLFYSIPVSKRSVYLMPAYPFLSVFIAQYILFLTEYKAKIFRFFAIFIGIIACIAGLLVFLTITTHWFDPVYLLSKFINNETWLFQFSAIWQSAVFVQLGSEILLILLLISIFILFNSYLKKKYLKTLYAVFGVYLCLLLLIDGVVLPTYKNSISIRPVAEKIKTNFPDINNNLFVMNNLLEYSNMYGLNFYLHNSFRNFEKETPSEGYFLTGFNSFKKVLQKYESSYTFDFLEEFPNYTRDGERIIQLYFFKKK